MSESTGTPTVDTLSEVERTIWATAFATAYVEKGEYTYSGPPDYAREAVLAYRKHCKDHPWAGVRL